MKKKDLKEIVQQLSDINSQLDKEAKILDDVNSAECQDLAVKLGNYIEGRYKDAEGVDTDGIIHPLEDYCELIYQMSLPENQNADMLHKLAKKIRKALLAADHGIDCDLPADRKQIVFLPYKASMWDSLESIWLAAKDDPEIDAYVISIPYFDRNPDGSVREWHYEGDQYPDYVPITDWQQYSIPDEKPDVIYIHNPYDGNNYVTSVHPSFYSSELKKYTDELVYVPYFVLPEVNPDKLDELKGMEHFVTVPGVIYADKVIVQSEAMKKAYVKIYLKFAKEIGLTGKHIDQQYQEQRIIGSGSPKIEKIKKLSKKEVTIPDKWKKYVYADDGSRKKIILYNNSISAILKDNDQMIDKMKRIFGTFKEYRNEVVLLWRPHPLIQSTLTSMRPALWDAYRQIVERYKAEDWGIYDDSPELDRAIAVSDAYYGDGSSIVELYKAIGKPVMIVNSEV